MEIEMSGTVINDILEHNKSLMIENKNVKERKNKMEEYIVELEEKVKGYEDIINFIMYEMNFEIGGVSSVYSIKVFVDKSIYAHLQKLWKKPRKSRSELGL